MHISVIKRIIPFILLFSSLFTSCDAPRNNPLDPDSDTKPFLESFHIYSVVRNKYPSLQSYQIVVEAKIKDVNNIIDSIIVENSYLDVRKFLDFNYKTGNYERTFNLTDLNTTEPDEIIGHDFHIKMKDYSFNEYELGLNDLKRIIKDEMRIESPIGGDTVSTYPVLKWRKFSGKFSFSYKIQIFTAEITPELVFEKEGISSDSISYVMENPLPPQDYFWIIWAVDQFRNRGSSKPATFRVN